MSEAIYILEAHIKCDLGFTHTEIIEYFFYFKSYGQAESHIPIFTDKAIRKFKARWKLDENDEDFDVEIRIKEKHIFDE